MDNIPGFIEFMNDLGMAVKAAQEQRDNELPDYQHKIHALHRLLSSMKAAGFDEQAISESRDEILWRLFIVTAMGDIRDDV